MFSSSGSQAGSRTSARALAKRRSSRFAMASFEAHPHEGAGVRAIRSGCVIPAHPLALTVERKLDERHQRALTRYYVAAGAGGVAVGVHTTQFAIRESKHGLLRPVLELAAETARTSRPHIGTLGTSVTAP